MIHNNNKIIGETSSPDKLLLADRGRVDSIIKNSLAASIYNKYFNLNVYVITDFLKDSWQRKIYESFGIKNFISFQLKSLILKQPHLFLKSILICLKVSFLLKFKGFQWLVNNFKVKNIHLGDLIYDSYVRYNLNYLNPKILQKDFLFILFRSVIKTIAISNFLEKESIKAVIYNTTMYASYSAISQRLAITKKIHTVGVNWFVVQFLKEYSQCLDGPRKIFKKDLERFNLSENWITKFEKHSISRFTGNIETPELIKAYKNKNIINEYDFFRIFNVKKNKYKKIVLFAPHVFSDAPHESFKMIFLDYFQHFVKTLTHIKDVKEVLWLIKAHPTSKDYNEEGLVEKMLSKYKKYDHIKLFPNHIHLYSCLNLVDTVITTRGTIGLEFAACFEKKPIILADAPYSNLGFTIEPKNEEEYFNILKNVEKITPLSKLEKLNAKKTFYFFECIQLDELKSSVIPKNGRFLSNDKYFDQLNKNLSKNNFEEDGYYKSLKKKILENFNFKKLEK